MKNIRFFIWKFYVFGGNIFYIFEKARFHNADNNILVTSSYLPLERKEKKEKWDRWEKGS